MLMTVMRGPFTSFVLLYAAYSQLLSNAARIDRRMLTYSVMHQRAHIAYRYRFK